LKLLNEEIFKCKKCGIALQTYCVKSEENWTSKYIYKRCPSCLEIYKIKLMFGKPVFKSKEEKGAA